MSTRVDADDIEATRSERFLAVVLGAFLLIGTIWFYVQVDNWIAGDTYYEPTAAEQAVLDDHDEALRVLDAAHRTRDNAQSAFDIAKNDLDIALQAGRETDELEAAYEQARTALQTAQAELEKADARERELGKQVEVIWSKSGQRTGGEEVAIAAARLAFVTVWLIGSYQLLNRMRRERSRWLPTAWSTVGAGVITALVFATDYITDWIDPLDLGPLVLSAVGALATIGAFVALQRWLAARLPGRRVRNGECPYCGHPVRDSATGKHCEGCGRAVWDDCGTCGADRRVGSAHCVNCGAA